MKRRLLEIDQALTVAAWHASKGERKGRKRERRLRREGKGLHLKFASVLCFSPSPLPSRFSFAPAKHLSLFSSSRQIKIEMPGTFLKKENSRCGTFEIPFYTMISDENCQTTEAPRGLTLNYSTFIINSNVPFLSSRFRNFSTEQGYDKNHHNHHH